MQKSFSIMTWRRSGQRYAVTLTRNSHAFTTPPARLATAAGISQYKPPPALTRKVSPATPTSTAVTVLGENRSRLPRQSFRIAQSLAALLALLSSEVKGERWRRLRSGGLIQ